jgi:membrane protein DedA with SNARE-associated domain
MLAGPVMASPWLYPLLGGMTAADAVLPIIPSEAAVLAAGVFAHSGRPNALLVIACVALGMVTGDHLAYALSRSVLGPRLIHRSKRLTRAVAGASSHLDRRGSLLIITSRFVPGGRVTLNAACGMTRLPLTRFTPASALAALAWAAYTVGLGYLGGAAFVAHPLVGLLAGLGLSVALGMAAELICKRAARRREAALLQGGRAPVAAGGGHAAPDASPTAPPARVG